VQAFGARWSGTLSFRREAGWEFSLAADRLDVHEVNRWLNPAFAPERPGLLGRWLPRRGTSEADEMIERLGARGPVAVGELVLPPLSLRRVRAAVELAGRCVAVREAQGEFYGGAARGSVRAQLAPEPAYDVEAAFERVNLAALAAAAPAWKDRFAGAAAGRLTLGMRGAAREGLVASLQGSGTLEARNAEWRGAALRESLAAGELRAGTSDFRSVTAAFEIGEGRVRISRLALLAAAPVPRIEGEGSADFAGALDIRLRPGGEGAPRRAFHLTGTPAAPQLAPLERDAAPARPSKAGAPKRAR
jgi:hypothetical protein